jgi:hypothetical protein
LWGFRLLTSENTRNRIARISKGAESLLMIEDLISASAGRQVLKNEMNNG